MNRDINRTEQLFSKALKLYEANNFDEAAILCRQVIALIPNHWESYYYIGLIFLEKKMYEQAITNFTRAIEINPNNSLVYFNRGIAYRELDEKRYIKTIISDFTRAIERGPSNPKFYNARGEAYYDEEEYDSAIADYSQAIKHNDNFFLAYYNRGTAYLKKYNDREAFEDFNKVSEIDPNFIKAYLSRGSIYISNKEFDKAIGEYTKALKVDPECQEAYRCRAEEFSRKVLKDIAQNDIQQAEYLETARLEAEEQFANKNRRRVKAKKLLLVFLLVITVGVVMFLVLPENPFSVAYCAKGTILQDMGAADKAIIAFTRAIQYKPTYAKACWKRGEIYDRRGDYEKALGDFSRAAAFQPSEYVSKCAAEYWEMGKRMKGNEQGVGLEPLKEWREQLTSALFYFYAAAGLQPSEYASKCAAEYWEIGERMEELTSALPYFYAAAELYPSEYEKPYKEKLGKLDKINRELAGESARWTKEWEKQLEQQRQEQQRQERQEQQRQALEKQKEIEERKELDKLTSKFLGQLPQVNQERKEEDAKRNEKQSKWEEFIRKLKSGDLSATLEQ